MYRFVLASALVLIPAVVSMGETRTWTDQQGQTVEAELVRVFNGMAILKQGNRVLRVPLNNLSEADQEYLRSGGQEPAEAIDDEDPAPNNDSGPLPIDRADPVKRTWTDRDGNQVEATFVRVHERNVIVQAGNRVRTLSFEELSDDDRFYVRDLIRSQGDQATADAIDRYIVTLRERAEREAQVAQQQAQRPAGRSSTVPSIPQFTTFPETNFPDTTSQLDQHRARMEEQQRQMMASMEESRRRRQEEMDRSIQESQRRREEMFANMDRQMENMRSSMQFHSSAEQKVCSNCNRAVSSSAKPGQNCPHCGGYWSFYEDERGKKQYAKGDGPGVRPGIGAIIGVIGLLVTGIAGLARRLSG